jgi:threonine dehydrogenase-like Zn-dependent dehydrogenase
VLPSLFFFLSSHPTLVPEDACRRVQFPAPGRADVISEAVPTPGPEEVRVRTRYSAISPGTERLVYEGNVPQNLDADASIEALEGDFSYPISYGYACVGRVEQVGDAVSTGWEDALVFAFQPHASRFVARPETLVPLPNETDPADAALIPSLETAVTLVMDGRPMMGESVVVFGQGIVGLLTTCLLRDHPLQELVAVEPVPARREQAAALGARTVASADALDASDTDSPVASSETASDGATDPAGADLVYELTGQPSVLNKAVAHTGFGGRLVVGSWYGTKQAPINLGGHFHRSRMRIVSSQVSTIDPQHRGRWTKDRRMSVVVDALSDIRPGRFISDRFPLEEAPSVYEKLARGASMLQPVFVYDA